MTEEKESRPSAELELEPETITDLDVEDEDADEVRGGPKGTCQYSNGGTL